MAWQLIAIWLVVATTLTWFVRDERRRRHDAELARAARYYAHAPRFRHVVAAPAPAPTTPPVRQGGLLRADKVFFDRLLSERTTRRFAVQPRR